LDRGPSREAFAIQDGDVVGTVFPLVTIKTARTLNLAGGGSDDESADGKTDAASL
jgi:hypothetical protein